MSPTSPSGSLNLQLSRQLRVATDTQDVAFFDRSPVCTLAWCRFLDRPPPDQLMAEVERLLVQRCYHRTALFVRHQGRIRATAARRISLEDSLAFEKVHELTYREAGFDLVEIPAASLPVRVAAVMRAVGGNHGSATDAGVRGRAEEV